MLIFGPYSAIPKDEKLDIFNLSSLTQAIPRLPGLIVSSNVPMYTIEGDGEKSFDMWYYDYVLNDPTACSSMMSVLQSLYDGHNVYVCISDYNSDPYISMINESFMKILQARYTIKYSIINTREDFYYVDRDGSDFLQEYGIYNFDEDYKRFLQVKRENDIMIGAYKINE